MWLTFLISRILIPEERLDVEAMTRLCLGVSVIFFGGLETAVTKQGGGHADLVGGLCCQGGCGGIAKQVGRDMLAKTVPCSAADPIVYRHLRQR
jgi:hypothetical protein